MVLLVVFDDLEDIPGVVSGRVTGKQGVLLLRNVGGMRFDNRLR